MGDFPIKIRMTANYESAMAISLIQSLNHLKDRGRLARKALILFGIGTRFLDGGIDRPPIRWELLKQLRDLYPFWGAIPEKYHTIFEQKFEEGLDFFIKNENPKNLVELQRAMALFSANSLT